jgi:hypothetical protein
MNVIARLLPHPPLRPPPPLSAPHPPPRYPPHRPWPPPPSRNWWSSPRSLHDQT